MYTLRILPKAAKYLKKIKEKELKKTFQSAIDIILQDPYIGKQKVGDLHSVYCYDIMYKKTNYEIAYIIEEDNGNMIILLLAGTRKNFYESLKKYMKKVHK